MKGNRIPRKFDYITAQMLINTNMDKIGDYIQVFKEEWGYRVLHLRTGEYSQANLPMLRNPECCKFIKVMA